MRVSPKLSTGRTLMVAPAANLRQRVAPPSPTCRAGLRRPRDAFNFVQDPAKLTDVFNLDRDIEIDGAIVAGRRLHVKNVHSFIGKYGAHILEQTDAIPCFDLDPDRERFSGLRAP